MGTIYWSYIFFGPVVQKKMSFKDISYLELWHPLCSADGNHLCNFGRRYHEEQFSEIILNSDLWFRRKCCLKVFIIWGSGSPFVQWSVNIWALLVEGIKMNYCEIILKLGQRFRRCLLNDFLSGALATLLFSGAEPFMQFCKRASWGTFMWSYIKLGSVVQEEMSFKEKISGRRNRRTKSSAWAFGSGELKHTIKSRQRIISNQRQDLSGSIIINYNAKKACEVGAVKVV